MNTEFFFVVPKHVELRFNVHQNTGETGHTLPTDCDLKFRLIDLCYDNR